MAFGQKSLKNHLFEPQKRLNCLVWACWRPCESFQVLRNELILSYLSYQKYLYHCYCKFSVNIYGLPQCRKRHFLFLHYQFYGISFVQRKWQNCDRDQYFRHNVGQKKETLQSEFCAMIHVYMLIKQHEPGSIKNGL